MGYVLVDPSGKSNAIAGDKVVTGGGIYEKMADGTSRLIAKLSTPSGKTSNYADVVAEFNRLASGGGGSNNNGSKNPTTTTPPVKTQGSTEIYDSPVNYDSFTLPLSYDYSGSSGASNATLSKMVGYGIVGLVLLVVADKLIGK